MSDDIRSLLKKHLAFYEVLPYYVLLEEMEESRLKTRRIQAGFDIDIYGVRTEDKEPVMPPSDEYTLGYTELQKIAEDVSRRTSNFCSLEVIPFPTRVVIDVRDHGKVEAMLRIRISHSQGLDQAAGLPEERALEEIEKELTSLGVARR